MQDRSALPQKDRAEKGRQIREGLCWSGFHDPAVKLSVKCRSARLAGIASLFGKY